MSKKNESNEELEKQTRKRKLFVGIRQQKRRIKFRVEEIDEEMLSDCRALTQSVASNDSRIDNCVTSQPQMECGAVQDTLQNQSTIEESFIDATETCYDASAEKYSSSECSEPNYEDCMSETDSYVELYDNFTDSEVEIYDSPESGRRDGVNDGTIDDQDTDAAEENSLMDEDKRKEAISKSSIAEWVIECNIPRIHVSNLLRRLKLDCGLSFLPVDSRTLMKTMRNKPHVRLVFPGQYAHFGLVNGLLFLLSYHRVDDMVTEIGIVIHIDGIPIAKSSGSQFWPILCSIYGYEKVVVVGIYHGLKKPEDVNEFLLDFVAEAKTVLEDGLKYGGKVIAVTIAALVCDAPARCFATNVVSHNAYYGCHKCATEGVWIRNNLPSTNHGGRVTYPRINDRLRSNESFRSRSQPRHHKQGRSIIEQLPFDLVKAVPVDYMHNVCIGVEKKLINTWISGKMDGTRISKAQVQFVSDFLVYIKKYVPVEFPRKTRTLDDSKHLKAAEHRGHLLYYLPVALRGVLPQNMYDHYMLFHVAIKILTSSQHCKTYANYAESLLKKFASDSIRIYGRKFITYNVHNLIHLPGDVKEIGSLDSYSAFPFENKLQSVKNLLRTSANPLAQVVRRIKEIEDIAIGSTAAPMSSEIICSDLHTDGPTHPNFKGYQYNFMKLQNWKIGTKRPNHCIFLKNGYVALVKNILKTVNGHISLIVQKYVQFENLYLSPICSKDFQELVVFELRAECELVDVDDIACKAIRFPMTQPKNGKYFVTPLLMSQL